jgi:hypothetical protein
VTVGYGEERSIGAVTTPAVSGTGMDRDPLGAAKVKLASTLSAADVQLGIAEFQPRCTV